MDAVRNLEVTFRSLGGGSKEKMQEDWESIDLKNVYLAVLDGRKETPPEPDSVVREVIQWVTCRLGVAEWLVSAVINMSTQEHHHLQSLITPSSLQFRLACTIVPD